MRAVETVTAPSHPREAGVVTEWQTREQRSRDHGGNGRRRHGASVTTARKQDDVTQLTRQIVRCGGVAADAEHVRQRRWVTLLDSATLHVHLVDAAVVKSL